MRYFILIVACFIGNSILAQDRNICEGIVGIAVKAVNNRSTDELRKHLASDFTCAGQTGTVAIAVMEQLVAQLNEHISDINEISEQQDNGTLTLVYDFNYSKKLGHKTATFVFNANNQLKQMDLLSVQVKKIDTKTDFKASAQDFISVPMDIQDGLIIVTAKLNGLERKFILDSGAPSLYLNSRYFTNDSITSISTTQSVNSSISGQDVVRVKSFDFQGIQIHDTDFVMSDLSHLLEDEEIYGLIGYQVIKDYDWLFDYANKTLILIKPDKTTDYISQMQYATYEIPLQMASKTSHIPCIKGKIGTEEICLGIDSGASANLLDIALFDKLKNNLTDITTTDLKGASKQKTNVQKTVVKSLAIGDKSFENVATAFNDMSHLNARYENKIDGLIGYEIFSKQKTIVSITNKKLIFITAFLAVGCSDDEPKDVVNEIKMSVSSETGVMYVPGSDYPIECMLVMSEDNPGVWEQLDFNGIKGFTYERGHEYYLSVERTILANPPMDAPDRTYSLSRILQDRIVTEPEIPVDKEINSEEDIEYYDMCPFNKYDVEKKYIVDENGEVSYSDGRPLPSYDAARIYLKNVLSKEDPDWVLFNSVPYQAYYSYVLSPLNDKIRLINNDSCEPMFKNVIPLSEFNHIKSMQSGDELRYVLILANIHKKGLQKLEFTIKKQ